MRIIESSGNLVHSSVKLRIIITEDDAFVGRVDVLYVGLLEDRIRFPIERNDGNNFEVVTEEGSLAQR